MFDNLCKFLVESFTSDFATWLLGEEIAFTELSPQELSLEPIRAGAIFSLEETFHRFEVIRLWEQPTEIFLRIPGLLPFAVLSNTDDKVNTLRQVATAIDQIPDRETQSNLIASSFILAGLVLEKEVVQRLLRSDDIMRKSSTYHLLAEEIEQEVREENTRLIAVNMLKEGLSMEIVAKVTI